jgi:predicted ABC-type ATPase
MDHTPRLRMFAGPNGSGKSTLKHVISDELLGVYVNADEIELSLREEGTLDLSRYQLVLDPDSVVKHFQSSSLVTTDSSIQLEKNRLLLAQLPTMSYHAAVTADLIRKELLHHRMSFSFETVMSHHDKVDLLQHAQSLGYRTYLYYIATDDPAINVSRVRLRVSQGGHNVPEEKIHSRYIRSLELLWEAIQHTNRAYLFDNSQDGIGKTWIAEVTNGSEIEVKTDVLPAWFKQAVWDKIASA